MAVCVLYQRQRLSLGCTHLLHHNELMRELILWDCLCFSWTLPLTVLHLIGVKVNMKWKLTLFTFFIHVPGLGVHVLSYDLTLLLTSPRAENKHITCLYSILMSANVNTRITANKYLWQITLDLKNVLPQVRSRSFRAWTSCISRVQIPRLLKRCWFFRRGKSHFKLTFI